MDFFSFKEDHFLRNYFPQVMQVTEVKLKTVCCVIQFNCFPCMCVSHYTLCLVCVCYQWMLLGLCTVDNFMMPDMVPDKGVCAPLSHAHKLFVMQESYSAIRNPSLPEVSWNSHGARVPCQLQAAHPHNG